MTSVAMPWKKIEPRQWLNRPGSILSTFVEFFWYHEDCVPINPKDRILLTGTVDLLINLNHEPIRMIDCNSLRQFHGAFVCGPHSEFFTIDPTKPQVLLGVHFKPGYAFLFLGLPASELLNRSIPLDHLWGRRADMLRERLLATATVDLQVGILEETLLAQLVQPLNQRPVIPFAIKELQQVKRITVVTDQIGLSQQRSCR